MNNNDGKPLVSVCCITFNQVSYIRQCLDGILMQKTTFPFEVIVHDDCSTDGTTEIIREYQQKFPNIIKPIIQKENQYSKGIKKILATFVYPRCQGKYYAICEGDDYWINENKLELQVAFMEQNNDYSMCFHNAVIKNEINEINSDNLYGIINDKEYSPDELFENWIVPTASILMKKECINYIFKNEQDFLYGDIKIVEACAHMGKVYGFNKSMSVYRIQKNGVTWDKARNYQRYLKLPKHFKAIKKSFPLISNKLTNDKIVESYLLCVLKCGNLFQKAFWLFSAFFTSPFAIVRNIKKYIKRKIK